MAILRVDIERALDELVSQENGMRFQGLAVALGKKRWPELIARQRKKDFGLDAYAPASLTPEKVGKGLAASVTPTLKKVSDDAKEAKGEFTDLQALLFVTSAKVGNADRKRWEQAIRQDYGLELHIIEREEIISSLLMPENAQLCASHLYLDVAVQPAVVDLMLERLRAESRGRSIARWQGVGVSAELANELADDQTVGIPDNACPLVPGQVTVLLAEFGSGKSLATERLYQRCLADFSADRTAPVPVYLELAPGRIPSFAEFRAVSETLGDIDSSGVVVFVERADEGGHAHALDCLAFARRLVSSFPRTSVLLPARPLVAFADIPEAVPLPPLTESEICALVKRVSGHDFLPSDLWRWSESVQTAMRRPLFAILIGLYLQGEHPAREILSPGELINRVVVQALQRTRIEVSTAEHSLARLGALTVERGGDFVHYSEIGTWSEVERLLSSGLVNRNEEQIGFPIPVIGQWFAAQAIQRRVVAISDALSDPVRRERWQDPLSIAIAALDAVVVDDIMERLASDDPGLASLVLEDAVGRSFDTTNKAGTPLSRNYEADLRKSWKAWLSGLGTGAWVAGAQSPSGSLLALRARASGELLTIGFYQSDQDSIASDSFDTGLPPGWVTSVQTGRPTGNRRAWAWQFTQERLKHGFNEGLRQHEIVLEPSCPLAVEAVWCGALAAVGKGGLNGQPIPIEQIERALETRGRGAYIKSYDFGMVEVELLQNALARLKEQGFSELGSPLPAPDIDNPPDNWVWSVYSDERLLERTRASYSLALAGYEHLVSRYFHKLGMRMRYAATLPATLTGILRPSYPASGENDLTKSPGLEYFLDPLPLGSSSRVNIVLPPASRPLPDVRDERVWETLRGLRPTAAEWLRPFRMSTVLDVFGGCPATKIAFNWIKADLRELKWL